MKPRGAGPLTQRLQISLSEPMFYALHDYCLEQTQTTGETIRHLLNKLLADKLGFPESPYPRN